MKLFLVAAACCLLVSPATAALRGSGGGGGRDLQTLTSLVLVNADTNQRIADIVDGAVITVPTNAALNVEATVAGDMPSAKVQFSYNGDIFRTETVAPYAFCGDKSGDFTACIELVPGPTITITAEVIVGSTPVSIATASFSLSNGPAPVVPPTPAPVIPPTPAPVSPPVVPPVSPPVAPPVPPPVSPPVAPPVPAPVAQPVAPPTQISLPWLETFSQANGTTVSSDGSWITTRFFPGEFSVQNGALRVFGDGSEAVLTTSEINISGTPVTVSLDVWSVGRLEAEQDYVRLYVKVDDQAEVLIGTVVGSQDSLASISGTGITGNKLVLVIRAYVSSTSEEYFLDNLGVSKPISSCGVPKVR